MTYVYNLIDFCKHPDISYHHQSLVVLESSRLTENRNAETKCSHFFDENKVTKLLAIERPHKSGQIYVATGLKAQYHFSCPTAFIPSLFNAIQKSNNKHF